MARRIAGCAGVSTEPSGRSAFGGKPEVICSLRALPLMTRSGHRGAESRGTTQSTPSPGTNRRGLSARGSRTVLFITRGFRDALRIAYQNRPRIFDWQIVLPEMLYSRRTDYSADWARRFAGDVEAGKSPSTSLPI